MHDDYTSHIRAERARDNAVRQQQNRQFAEYIECVSSRIKDGLSPKCKRCSGRLVPIKERSGINPSRPPRVAHYDCLNCGAIVYVPNLLEQDLREDPRPQRHCTLCANCIPVQTKRNLELHGKDSQVMQCGKGRWGNVTTESWKLRDGEPLHMWARERAEGCPYYRKRPVPVLQAVTPHTVEPIRVPEELANDLEPI